MHHGGNTKYGYYDNIMITNYNNEETVKMVAENVGIESESVKVDVAFSENLTGIPQNGDFVITDSFTGKRIKYRKSTRLNSSHTDSSRMPSSA